MEKHRVVCTGNDSLVHRAKAMFKLIWGHRFLDTHNHELRTRLTWQQQAWRVGVRASWQEGERLAS